MTRVTHQHHRWGRIGHIKPLADVPSAPGAAEGPDKASWEDLRYRWSPAAAALVCRGHQEQRGPWGSFAPPACQSVWGVKSIEQDTGHRGCLHRVPWEGTQMSLNMFQIRAVLSAATAAAAAKGRFMWKHGAAPCFDFSCQSRS